MGHDYVDNGEASYLSIDPGLTTGYAVFRSDGSLIRSGTVYSKTPKELYEWLAALNVTKLELVIVEDYTLFPWKAMAQSWAKLETVRYIGAIDLWRFLNNIEIVYQDPNVKTIAYKWAGMVPSKNHAHSHEPDAFVHGVYYLQSHGIRAIQAGRYKE